MKFGISGVEVFPLVPVLVGFCIAVLTTPAGVSGAFLLLPFQLSVLNFTSPGVTPTNLIFNVISTPGGIARYRAQGDFDWRLVRSIAAGAGPGVITGSVLRVTVFNDPGSFKVFVGCVLLAIALLLAAQTVSFERRWPDAQTFAAWPISLLGALAGTIGGIYGVSGGSIIAPVLAGVWRLPVRRVAPAALVATLMTSVAGVISFEIIGALEAGVQADPDWLLAALFGVGGLLGSFTGARLSTRLDNVKLKGLLAVLAAALAATYIAPAL